MKKISIIFIIMTVCLVSIVRESQSAQSNPIVTFIELGSVNCIPCKQMQPVMKRVEQKYGSQVKVVFYDVWTEKEKSMAYKYKIRAIPTQVFLASDGKEYSRHEGYFPFEDLEKNSETKRR